MRVLLAGFGPFPGAPSNPSATLVKALARRRRPALTALVCRTHVFATTYAAVDRDMPRLFADKPDVVLLIGLAGRRLHLCLETRARNATSMIFPDASGHHPSSPVIESGWPGVLIGRAPFVPLLAALHAAGVPARLSRDAGRYLCNYAYWRALRQTHNGRPLVQFLHIPAIARDAQPRSRRRDRSSRCPPSLRQLIIAIECVLIALAAASRR
ncbi:MAG: pyroglutamyl-peptidase I [Xanthobacteraceae bacterium]